MISLSIWAITEKAGRFWEGTKFIAIGKNNRRVFNDAKIWIIRVLSKNMQPVMANNIDQIWMNS